MRKYWILTKLQLSSFYGINKLIHGRSPEDRKRNRKNIWVMIAMIFSLCYVSILYSLLLAQSLRQTGQLPVLLALMTAAASLLVLIFSIFETKSVLFGFRDSDLVLSWPVPISTVAASRVTAMYTYNLIYAVLLLVPAGIIYGVFAKAAWWYYPLFLLLTMFVPALPTVLGAALGTLVALLTAGRKKSSLLSAAVQMVFVFGVMAVSMGLSTGINQLADNPASMMQAVRYYPPAMWMAEVATVGSKALSSSLLLVGVTAFSMALLTYLLSKGYVKLSSRLAAVPQGPAYRHGRLQRRGRVQALYRMEWKRYMSVTIYLTNTFFGYVMLLIIAVVLGVVRPAGVEEFFSMPELGWIRQALPLMAGWMTMMASTTASSVSIEGNKLWIVKSMPIPGRDWLLAKLMVSLTPAVPALAVSTALVGVGMRLNVSECIWLFVTPLCFSVFASVAGLWLNLQFPKLDWKTETEVVKQSVPVMLQVFASMVLIGVSIALLALTQSGLVIPAVSVLTLVAALLIWRRLVHIGDARLYRL